MARVLALLAVSAALAGTASAQGSCNNGCTVHDMGDYCSHDSDCDEDYNDGGVQCRCEDEYAAPPSPPPTGGHWQGVGYATRNSVTPGSCTKDPTDAGYCAYKCSEAYSVSIERVGTQATSQLTLTPPQRNLPGCDTFPCGTGTADVTMFTTDTITGSFEDGTTFTVYRSDPNAETATVEALGCTGHYQLTYVNLDDVAAAVGIFLFFVIFLGFAVPMGGIMCCIKSKAQATGATPQAMAWIGCVLIFFFSGCGPCLMWIPFVMDGCYNHPNRGGVSVATRIRHLSLRAIPWYSLSGDWLRLHCRLTSSSTTGTGSSR